MKITITSQDELTRITDLCVTFRSRYGLTLHPSYSAPAIYFHSNTRNIEKDVALVVDVLTKWGVRHYTIQIETVDALKKASSVMRDLDAESAKRLVEAIDTLFDQIVPPTTPTT